MPEPVSVPSPSQAPRYFSRPAARIVVAVLLGIGAVSTTGILVARLRPNADPRKVEPVTPEAPSKDLEEFAKQNLPSWKGQKPELVIFFSGQQHNYEAPCGCTEPQYGGLERRYNFFTQVRSFGIPTVALDLGDIYYPGKFADQAKVKYLMSMKGLALMGYDAIAVGPEEVRLPLIDALAESVLNAKVPYEMLAATISNKDAFPGENGSMLKDFRIVEPKGGKLKVGVTAAFSESAIAHLKKIDPSLAGANPPVAFGRNPDALKGMLAQGPDIKVLLYEGTREEAEIVAQEVNEFDVILYQTDQSEPSGSAKRAKPAKGQTLAPKALLVEVGHKGRYVGVLGVFRTADGKLDLRWEPFRLGAEFKTPSDKQESHPIIQLLETYTKKLKDDDYLGKVRKVLSPLATQLNKPNLKYVGSEACMHCHAKEFAVWNASKHQDGYATLSDHPKAKPPHNRQYDPECIICHTVGFGYRTGFRDNDSGYKTADLSKHLFGVGCENCHGPGGEHVADPKDVKLQKALSPWREKAKEYLTLRAMKENKTAAEAKAVPDAEQKVADRVFDLCFKCHDTDNDHNFSQEKRWKSIAHGKGPTVK